MDQPVFLDTNILVYVYDKHEPEKHEVAKTFVLKELNSKKTVISSQVVGEFCNVMLTKKGHVMTHTDLQSVIRDILHPLVAHMPSMEFYQRAVKLFGASSISFYDALIIQAALDLDCDTLYSEDLQDGQIFGKLKIVNPFRKAKT